MYENRGVDDNDDDNGLLYHIIRMWNVPEARGMSTLSKLSLKSGDSVQNKNKVGLLAYLA